MDIVKVLRKGFGSAMGRKAQIKGYHEICGMAALEVESLRAELAECKRDADRAEVERLRGVLVEVMEWTERYTAPGHPISTVIRAALAKGE